LPVLSEIHKGYLFELHYLQRKGHTTQYFWCGRNLKVDVGEGWDYNYNTIENKCFKRFGHNLDKEHIKCLRDYYFACRDAYYDMLHTTFDGIESDIELDK
jgi:hypothetical protein